MQPYDFIKIKTQTTAANPRKDAANAFTYGRNGYDCHPMRKEVYMPTYVHINPKVLARIRVDLNSASDEELIEVYRIKSTEAETLPHCQRRDNTVKQQQRLRIEIERRGLHL